MHTLLVPIYLRAFYKKTRYKLHIDDLVSEMQLSGYQKHTLSAHLREWLYFLKNHRMRGNILPKIDDPSVLKYLNRRCKNRNEGQRHIRASLRFLLSNEAPAGTHLRKNRSKTKLFARLVPTYLKFLKQQKGRKETRTTECYLLQFFLFLGKDGIEDSEKIEVTHYRKFLENCSLRMTKAVVAGVASVLRGLAQYLFLTNQCRINQSASIESPRVYQNQKQIQILDLREIDQLLDAVDRSYATGKRDYAMLLLAARYGLRPSDIRSLTFDDVHWRQGRISILQVKTGKQLELPLLPDVEEALIDYIQNGRPKHNSRQIFLKHIAPIQPLGTTNNLWQVMERGLRAARINVVGRGRGMRLLRHCAATQMMRQGIEWETIAAILGHESSNTTRKYAHVDLEALRDVALDPTELGL